MSGWVSAEEFSNLSGQKLEDVEALCNNGQLACRMEEGELMVELGSGSQMVLASKTAQIEGNSSIDRGFIEKTLGTIMGLHERVIEAKDETLEALRRENKFLKEGLLSMQEIYDADRNTIEALTKQLQTAQEELEFAKRKYKLMWGQVIEKHSQNS